jgi:hypothetical protein
MNTANLSSPPSRQATHFFFSPKSFPRTTTCKNSAYNSQNPTFDLGWTCSSPVYDCWSRSSPTEKKCQVCWAASRPHQTWLGPTRHDVAPRKIRLRKIVKLGK